MESQVIIRIDSKIKERFYGIVRMEGKTASEKVREMINEYVSKGDISASVDEIWNEITKKMKKKGISQADVDKAIKEVRKMK
jgi:antitoxin component of RelBE/YafQ-DinJ toxin-antitoxin module